MDRRDAARFWSYAALSGLVVLLFVRLVPHAIREPDTRAVQSLFVATAQPFCHPEPVEQAQYVGGVLLCFALGVAARRVQLRSPFLLPIGIAAQVAAAFLLFATLSFERYYSTTAIAIAAVCGAIVPFAPIRAPRSKLVLIVPLLYAGIALLSSLHTEASLPFATRATQLHLPFTIGEIAAPLHGKTPLVDFHAQYVNLLPLLAKPIFALVPLTVTSFTALMAALSFVGLAAVLGALVLVTRRASIAAVLFMSFAAASFYGASSYYAYNPFRTVFPWCSAFLLARYLRAPSEGRLFALFIVTTLGAINNVDLGVPAFVACAVALFFVAPRGQLLRTAALAVGGAVLLYLACALLASGHLPRPSQLFVYQRIFAAYGFYAFELPTFGLYWAILATHGLALLYALTVQSERVVRGMIFFAAVLGFGAFTYYLGRSHEEVLPTQFPFFALTNALLLYAIWSARHAIVPRALAATVFFLPLVASTPSPRKELARLGGHDRAYSDAFAGTVAVVSEHEGANVVIVYPYADLIALRAHVRNLNPFAHPGSLILRAQVAEVAALDVERVYGSPPPELREALIRKGFREIARLHPANAIVRGAGFEDFVVYERTSP